MKKIFNVFKKKLPKWKPKIDYFSENINILNKKGLEIGALHNPMLDKKDVDIYFADIIDDKVSIKQFDLSEAEVENIVKVDFLISPRKAMREQINMTFDFVIANHVLEHSPNPIGFLKQIEELLEPGGFLFLSLPDKRFTFDIDRQTTSLEHILDDWHRDAKNNEYQHFFDWLRYGSHKGRPLKEIHQDTLKTIETMGETPNTHYHVFTFETFKEIISQTIEIGLLNYSIEFSEPIPRSIEFVCILKKNN